MPAARRRRRAESGRGVCGIVNKKVGLRVLCVCALSFRASACFFFGHAITSFTVYLHTLHVRIYRMHRDMQLRPHALMQFLHRRSALYLTASRRYLESNFSKRLTRCQNDGPGMNVSLIDYPCTCTPSPTRAREAASGESPGSPPAPPPGGPPRAARAWSVLKRERAKLYGRAPACARAVENYLKLSTPPLTSDAILVPAGPQQGRNIFIYITRPREPQLAADQA